MKIVGQKAQHEGQKAAHGKTASNPADWNEYESGEWEGFPQNVPGDDEESVYCNASADGSWVVGEAGPSGREFKSGKAESLEAAKDAAEAAYREFWNGDEQPSFGF